MFTKIKTELDKFLTQFGDFDCCYHVADSELTVVVRTQCPKVMQSLLTRIQKTAVVRSYNWIVAKVPPSIMQHISAPWRRRSKPSRFITYKVTITAPNRNHDEDTLEDLIDFQTMQTKLRKISGKVLDMIDDKVAKGQTRKDALFDLLKLFERCEETWAARGRHWKKLQYQHACQEVFRWIEILNEESLAVEPTPRKD
jgi:hypothetical protein